jgi:hypothetical protein
MSSKARTTLQRSGINVLMGTFLAPFLRVGLVFAAAGNTRMSRVWLYLCDELPGYAEYSHRVRYRLFPGIW